MGLAQGQEKMSKSDPNSAIFMEDSEQVCEDCTCFLEPKPSDLLSSTFVMITEHKISLELKSFDTFFIAIIFVFIIVSLLFDTPGCEQEDEASFLSCWNCWRYDSLFFFVGFIIAVFFLLQRFSQPGVELLQNCRIS